MTTKAVSAAERITLANPQWSLGLMLLALHQLLGLMTVYENRGRYDTSNVWFENGATAWRRFRCAVTWGA